MLFREYVKHINKMLEENPESGEYKVVYASDEEGNHYAELCYPPSIGFHEDGEFVVYSKPWDSDDEFNAVCIN